MARKKKKKFKGFKVVEVAHSFIGEDDYLNFAMWLQIGDSAQKANKLLEKYAKSAQTPPEKCVKGEYCPKQSGCCWDYAKKKEEEKHAA